MHSTTALTVAAAIFGLVSSQDTSSTGTSASEGSSDWPDIAIKSITFSGSGCPQGTVKLMPGNKDDGSSWLYFNPNAFNVSIGPGSEYSDHTKNCEVHANLVYPEGVTIAATAALTQGYVDLDAGVSATWYSTYFFSQDAGRTTTTQTTIEGGGHWAGSQLFRKVDTVPDASRVWAPCGGAAILNANVRIALTSDSSSAKGAVSLEDDSRGYGAGFRLDWKRCKA